MKQDYNDSFGLDGFIEFEYYDKQGKLFNHQQNKNEIKSQGKILYANILSSFLNPNYPLANTTDDSEQVSITSNYIDFSNQSGCIQFLQPINVRDKQFGYLQNCFICTSDPQSLNKQNSRVGNENSFLKNSQNEYTTVDTNVVSKGSDSQFFLCLVYNLSNLQNSSQSDLSYSSVESNSLESDASYSSISANDVNVQQMNLYNNMHTGLRIDMNWETSKKNFFRIAYIFEDRPIEKYSDIGNFIFPNINGKPCCRFNGEFFGGRLMQDQIYSYFFDMYPRCCKMPKKIVFVFQTGRLRDNHNSYDNYSQANIQRIQFFTHKKPNSFPASIYLSGTKNNSEVQYKIPILKSKIISDDSGNFLCYYAKLNYSQANGCDFKKMGLCTTNDIIKCEPDAKINAYYHKNYIDNGVVIAGSPISEFIYNIRFADSQQCDIKLTQSSCNIQKTENNRIDILYKIKINFGTQNNSL